MQKVSRKFARSSNHALHSSESDRWDLALIDADLARGLARFRRNLQESEESHASPPASTVASPAMLPTMVVRNCLHFLLPHRLASNCKFLVYGWSSNRIRYPDNKP